MIISMIVAKGINNEIGADNKLLWHIPSDLKFFKSVTMGKSIIMGRKTFESLPKALPGRKNIVLSRNKNCVCEGAVVVADIDEAIKECETDEVFVIGGEAIYNLFMPLADKLYITEVEFTYENADAFFPNINENMRKKTLLDEGEENSLKYRHFLYEK